MNKLIAGMHQAAGVLESCVSISPPLDNQFTVIDSRSRGGQTVIIAHVHTCHHQVKPTPQLEHPTTRSRLSNLIGRDVITTRHPNALLAK